MVGKTCAILIWGVVPSYLKISKIMLYNYANDQCMVLMMLFNLFLIMVNIQIFKAFFKAIFLACHAQLFTICYKVKANIPKAVSIRPAKKYEFPVFCTKIPSKYRNMIFALNTRILNVFKKKKKNSNIFNLNDCNGRLSKVQKPASCFLA